MSFGCQFSYLYIIQAFLLTVISLSLVRSIKQRIIFYSLVPIKRGDNLNINDSQGPKEFLTGPFLLIIFNLYLITYIQLHVD